MKFPNKDVRGALMAAVGVVILFGLLLVVSGCAISPEYRPELEIGASYEVHRDEHVVGNNPAGILRLRQPLKVFKDGCSKLFAEYEHLSSIPDMDDKATVDQIGLVARICLGRNE